MYFFDSNTHSNVIQKIAAGINKGENFVGNKVNFDGGGVIIDIGAHVGLTACYYSILYPTATIYAFEPDPENFLALQKNLAINKIENVVPIEKGITSDGRDVNLMVNKDSWSSTIIENDLTKKYCKVSHGIETTTLETFFCKNNISRCKILKIDCEGAEYEIFHNVSDSILAKIDYIVGEIHTRKQPKGYSIPMLMKKLEDNNIVSKFIVS